MKPVKGHALVAEGAPHDKQGRRIYRYSFSTTGGHGRGMCECGALSEWLRSPNQRKAWHREHKAEVQGGDS